ncbi:MAG: VanZ family protein, partial [Thiobacillus sp.]|nr:VanZ family protein [Thiobacillus sp.]
FRTDGAFIKSRLDFIYRVPFEVYYFGTEYRAITEVLRKTLFFAPLGAMLAWGVTRQPWRWRSPSFVLAMLILVLMPAVIELGQVMLPEKIADTTDWLLAWLGGLAGYGVVRRVLSAPRSVMPLQEAAGKVAPHSFRSIQLRWHFPLVWGGLALLFWTATHAPFVPYNVRELLLRETAWLSALLLALTVYWLAAWPVWLARRRVSGRVRLVQLPLGLLVYGACTFLLLNAAVPDESLHDLVGSPVLHWPWKWETGLRWIVLAAWPGVMLYAAAQTVRRWRGLRLSGMHFWIVLPILGLAYWGVVAQAASDNLIELIAIPQLLGFTALCAWFYTLFLAAAWLASPIPAAFRNVRWIGVAISLPLSALLLYLGLAGEIEKYGQQFSALQFLLSTDRQHYASQSVIWLRYSVVYVLAIGALAFIQWPYFRDAQHTPTPINHAPH